jgi:hypothetical protein
MAWFPKNKAKLKTSKEGEFIYQDDRESFKGAQTYIKTSKGHYFEGENVSSPGRVIIPTQKKLQKDLLLNLLKKALTQLATTILAQLLGSLLQKLLNPGDIQQVEQAQEILETAISLDRELTEQEQNEIKDLLDSIDSDEVPDFLDSNNTVINTGIYNKLKPGIFGRLNSNKLLIPTKIRPKDEDYNNGSYVRYFTKRNNSNEYFEINKSSYNSIKDRKNIFDINLYQVYSINWSLGRNSEETNTNIISRYERALPGIKNLFNDPTEYAQVIKNNLYTEGNELYFESGLEYIGEYHIHPINGPMVGSSHTEEPHDNLYYSHELGTSKSDPSTQNDTSVDPQSKLFKTIGYNEYYIKSNNFGVYCEVLDTLASPDSVFITLIRYVLSYRNKKSIRQTNRQIKC